MTVSYQRILVPLDGSERAAAALGHAETIAKLAGAQVRLIHVIPNAAMLISETAVSAPGMGLPTVDPYLSANQYESVEAALRQEGKTLLDSSVAQLQAKGISAEAVLVEGTPADGILAYAKENQIDLIVMSTHGRTGLARLVFGSVAENVLHQATCPVLFVRVMGK